MRASGTGVPGPSVGLERGSTQAGPPPGRARSAGARSRGPSGHSEAAERPRQDPRGPLEPRRRPPGGRAPRRPAPRDQATTGGSALTGGSAPCGGISPCGPYRPPARGSRAGSPRGRLLLSSNWASLGDNPCTARNVRGQPVLLLDAGLGALDVLELLAELGDPALEHLHPGEALIPGTRRARCARTRSGSAAARARRRSPRRASGRPGRAPRRAARRASPRTSPRVARGGTQVVGQAVDA